MFEKVLQLKNNVPLAFLYLKFLSSAESQLYWAQLVTCQQLASVRTRCIQENSGSKVPKILADATKKFILSPVVENSDPTAYSEVRTISF